MSLPVIRRLAAEAALNGAVLPGRWRRTGRNVQVGEHIARCCASALIRAKSVRSEPKTLKSHLGVGLECDVVVMQG